jgi:3-deoxy-7-phosphoheptulonate synthase
MYEKDNKTLTYRGDIIHSFENREIDPNRLLMAYYKSGLSLNALRSFAKSGDLNLNNIENWIYPSTEFFEKYSLFLQKFQKTIKFINNLNTQFNIEPNFFVSHEALLLHYEEVLTRQDSNNKLWYNCGAHTIWLGERTRNSDAHIEYLSGIENPIGIKLGATDDLEYLKYILEKLNPKNEIDKIMIIIRMGDKIETELPKLIEYLQKNNLNVILMCDPCHANTKIINNKKTRFTKTINNEIMTFIKICHQMKYIPGGIHLEISGSPLTECVGENVIISDLDKNYQSRVDPRINNIQMINLALSIGENWNNLYNLYMDNSYEYL